MLSVVVFLPLAAAVLLAVARHLPDAAARVAWVGVAAVDLGLVAVLWAGYLTPPPGGLAFEERVPWIPGVDSSYHVGVDGLSLPLVALTAVVFLACAVYALRERRRPRQQAALFLFLQTTCLGVFAAADLILFFVFFDLSIVGMYFVIAGWGHGDAARSALKFFLYTFLGSLALLLGFIGLFVAAEPHTFDMVALAAAPPLLGDSVTGGLVLAAVLVGLAVKTPTVPFHTWLPPAHTDAPADRLGGAGGGAAEDGHVRLRPDRHADAAGRVARVGVGGARRRSGVRAVRRARRAGADRPEADDRLHVGEPHGLRGGRRGRGRNGRGRRRRRPRGRGDRRGDPDGRPRPHHRGAVPARRSVAGPGRHLRHGLLRRARGARAEVRHAVRRRRLRLPRPARLRRVHRRVPGVHRQHRRGARRRARAAGHPRHRRAVPAGAATDLHRGDRRTLGGLRRPAGRRGLVGGPAAAGRAAARGPAPAPCST